MVRETGSRNPSKVLFWIIVEIIAGALIFAGLQLTPHKPETQVALPSQQ